MSAAPQTPPPAIELIGIDKRFGPFTGSQWTALVVALICAGLLIYLAISKRPGPTTPGRREPVPEGATPEDAAPATA